MKSGDEEKLSNDWPEETAVDLGEMVAGAAFILGECSTKLPEHFRKKAGDLFAAGDDDMAHIYRNIAEEIEAIQKEKRERYDEVYAPQSRQAFEDLGRIDHQIKIMRE